MIWQMNDMDIARALLKKAKSGINVSMIVDGSWSFSEYDTLFDDNLGVARMPSGPSGSANPFVFTNTFYVNPNSTNKDVALDLIKYLTNQESVTKFMNEAFLIPAREDVQINNTYMKEFKQAIDYGTVIPNDDSYESVLYAFNTLFDYVLLNDSSLVEGTDAACEQLHALQNSE